MLRATQKLDNRQAALEFNFRDVQTYHTSLDSCLPSATARVAISSSYYFLLLKGFRTVYNNIAYFAKSQLLGTDTISWRSKLAERRSSSASHDPHADVYLNILQPGQSRSSTFKSRLRNCISVNILYGWWWPLRCGGGRTLGVRQPRRLRGRLLGQYTTVWPGCHTATCPSSQAAHGSPWVYQESPCTGDNL